MEKQFFIERTNKDRSFTVIGRYYNYEIALQALKKIKSSLRHELWCYGWVNTVHGYAPMASIN